MNLEEIKDRYVDYEYDFNLKKEHINWLIEQAEKVEQIKKIVHESTDTDSLYFNDDGSIKYLGEREVLEEIEKMVMYLDNNFSKEGIWENEI